MENDDDLRTYLRVPNYINNRKIFPLRSCLEKIIVQGYKALGLEYFFTAGPDEVKAWTIQKYTKAPQAAGRIHTDFEKGFIMAEVMKFNDFKEEGSEAAAKVRRAEGLIMSNKQGAIAKIYTARPISFETNFC